MRYMLVLDGGVVEYRDWEPEEVKTEGMFFFKDSLGTRKLAMARRIICMDRCLYIKNREGCLKEPAWVDFGQPVEQLQEDWAMAKRMVAARKAEEPSLSFA